MFLNMKSQGEINDIFYSVKVISFRLYKIILFKGNGYELYKMWY